VGLARQRNEDSLEAIIDVNLPSLAQKALAASPHQSAVSGNQCRERIVILEICERSKELGIRPSVAPAVASQSADNVQ
jgi:hypothetical protein